MRVMRVEDRDLEIFRALSRRVLRKKSFPESAGKQVLQIGRYFLGAPYAERTLETGEPESLVINLRQFDCYTFLENVVALAATFRSGDASFSRYRKILAAVRYRHGRPEGYASRLHYFTDWLFCNQRKGILRNMSRMLGGQPFSKKIDFMTKHADQYPALQDRDTCRQMQAVERRIRRRIGYLIPKSSVNLIEDRMLGGDLVAVATNREGLDIMHVGFAVHINDRLHLLHASSKAGRVVISEEPLDGYLMENSSRTGIVVARANSNHFFTA